MAWKSKGKAETTIAMRKKKLQIRLALIMSLTVLEFFIFYMPQFGIVMASLFARVTGSLTFGNEVTTFGWGLWFLDATFNPLWTTFLSKAKRTQVSGQTTTMSK